MISIRKATVEDLTTLLEFEQGIIIAERPFNPTLKPDPISYYDLKEIILNEDSDVYVGETEGKIVCSASVIIKPGKPYVKHEKHAYLGFMYVLPEFRGKGLNKLIMAQLKSWAAERGLTELRLTVYAENLPAIKAYEKAGFKSLITEMRLNLEEE